MKRREFLIKSVTGGFALSLPLVFKGNVGFANKNVSFGVCADVHQDIMHDAKRRLKTFIDSAENENNNFIIQLGDFCRPYETNKAFLNIWDSFSGSKYHVLGNHDMDGGFSRETVLKFWSSPAKYYSFSRNGFHFIVLDGNDINPSEDKASGYARYIGSDQQEWLRKDLQNAEDPVVIFSHQSIEGDHGIENAKEIRSILNKANEDAGFNKVLACFSGHHHTDYYTSLNGIYYIQINSMSYSWLGDKYKTIRYSEEIDQKYPWIKYTAPYKEPLFAMVEIGNGKITITGRSTEFVGKSPKDLGVTTEPNSPIVSKISNQKLIYKTN